MFWHTNPITIISYTQYFALQISSVQILFCVCCAACTPFSLIFIWKCSTQLNSSYTLNFTLCQQTALGNVHLHCDIWLQFVGVAHLDTLPDVAAGHHHRSQQIILEHQFSQPDRLSACTHRRWKAVGLLSVRIHKNATKRTPPHTATNNPFTKLCACHADATHI